MQVSAFAPSERLAPFVRSFTVVETDEPATRTLLPDTGVILGFRYRGSARELIEDTAVPDATIAGVRGTPRRMYTSKNGGVVLTTFHEAEAAQFFAEPLHELFGRTLPIDALMSARDAARTLEQIGEAQTHRGRIAVIEELLFARRVPERRDPLVRAAVRALRAAQGNVRIEDLATELGLSRDRLEKRFRRAVGSSPKQLASILRLQRAIALHQKGASLTEVSADAGFADQSHFIREFKRFAGESPQKFFGAGDHC